MKKSALILAGALAFDLGVMVVASRAMEAPKQTALPFAAAIRMLVEELRLSLPGDDTEEAELRARDERTEQEFEVRAHGRSPRTAGEIAVALAKERDGEPDLHRKTSPPPITSGLGER